MKTDLMIWTGLAVANAIVYLVAIAAGIVTFSSVSIGGIAFGYAVIFITVTAPIVFLASRFIRKA